MTVFEVKAPTNKSFYQPKEHRFSANRDQYGSYFAWLNFQKELFKFSKERNIVVVTDIANYYDSIWYAHLRNTLSSISGADECIIDMLIYILSDLLWQPDYSPRIEVGLPQINLDAPRLLAHCFLYELDTYLDKNGERDFVRYMDDIDVGVDSYVEAKKVLQEIDLVLQTKQVRLNSGKSKILSQKEALIHFRVEENAEIDQIEYRLKKNYNDLDQIAQIKSIITKRIKYGLSKNLFESGNGDKVLKRWISLAGICSAYVPIKALHSLLLMQPQMRSTIFRYFQKIGLKAKIAKSLADIAKSGHLVDDAGFIDLANQLVETRVQDTSQHQYIKRIYDSCDEERYFGLYCKLWLQSKYCGSTELLQTIVRTQNYWMSDNLCSGVRL